MKLQDVTELEHPRYKVVLDSIEYKIVFTQNKELRAIEAPSAFWIAVNALSKQEEKDTMDVLFLQLMTLQVLAHR